MNGRLSSPTRAELLHVLRQRYQTAKKLEKGKILDEFVAMTGTHRKHAIRVLRKKVEVTADKTRNGNRIYDEAVKEALVVVWEASDRICGKRLKAVLPQFVEAMERHGHLELDPEVRQKLLDASAATIDRLLKPHRKKSNSKKKRAKTKPSEKVKIKTFSEWDEPVPGYMEIDFVVHCGGTTTGEKVHSLVATDVCSGWTEAIPLVAREQSLVVAGLEALRKQLPFPMLGFNSDNDSAFINDTLLDYCERSELEFTRSRAYRSNDQAWIEQKNGAVIRKLVGYKRYTGMVAAQTLAALYQSARLFVNYFQPSVKLLSKERDGSKCKRRFSPPITPADRLLKREDVEGTIKEQLKSTRQQLDPIELPCRVRHCQEALTSLADGNTDAPQAKALPEFLAELPQLWKQGETRPTHRRAPSRERTWRTRKDPFEEDWPTILKWLEESPDATALSLLKRLIDQNPTKYQRRHLRTLQRRVKDWRHLMARQLVYNCLPEPVDAIAIQDKES